MHMYVLVDSGVELNYARSMSEIASAVEDYKNYLFRVFYLIALLYTVVKN